MTLTTTKKYVPYILLAIGLLVCISPAIAYGLTSLLPFWKAYSLVSAILVPVVVYWQYKVDLEKGYEQYVDKELERLNEELGLVSNDLGEKVKVIDDYHILYDSILWEIPCNCNENVFVGLFSPYSDNIVQCEKCKNSYRITLNYESVLLTEPLNNEQIFDSLKTKIQSEPEDTGSPMVQVV